MYFLCVICSCIGNFLLLFLSLLLPPTKFSPLFLKLFFWDVELLGLIILNFLCFFTYYASLPLILLSEIVSTLPSNYVIRMFIFAIIYNFQECFLSFLNGPFCGILTFIYKQTPHLHSYYRYFLLLPVLSVFLPSSFSSSLCWSLISCITAFFKSQMTPAYARWVR